MPSPTNKMMFLAAPRLVLIDSIALFVAAMSLSPAEYQYLAGVFVGMLNVTRESVGLSSTIDALSFGALACVHPIKALAANSLKISRILASYRFIAFIMHLYT